MGHSRRTIAASVETPSGTQPAMETGNILGLWRCLGWKVAGVVCRAHKKALETAMEMRHVRDHELHGSRELQKLQEGPVRGGQEPPTTGENTDEQEWQGNIGEATKEVESMIAGAKRAEVPR